MAHSEVEILGSLLNTGATIQGEDWDWLFIYSLPPMKNRVRS